MDSNCREEAYCDICICKLHNTFAQKSSTRLNVEAFMDRGSSNFDCTGSFDSDWVVFNKHLDDSCFSVAFITSFWLLLFFLGYNKTCSQMIASLDYGE